MNATTRLRGGWRSAARERWEHGLGVRRRPLGGTSIESWGFRTEDGRCGTLLETEHVDIEAVDPARRGRVVDAFAQICRSLEQPLRVIVQVRPFEIASMPAERLGREGQLEAAMKDHWRQQLQSEPAFRRTILLVPVVEGRFQENVIRASTALATAVASAGIRASTAEEAAWSNLLDTRSNQDWEEHRSWARIGDTWVRGFVLTRLPGRAVRAGWLTPLLTVKASCDIAIQLSPLQPLEAITLLGRRLRNLGAQQLDESERGIIPDAHTEVAIDNAVSLRERLARNMGRPLHLAVIAVARAANLRELDETSAVVRAAFSATSCRVEPTHFRHLRVALAARAHGPELLEDAKLVDSEAAATCLPWVEASCYEAGGYRLGLTRSGGTPVRIAPFHGARYGNANIGVFAASGHGKSFAVGTMVLEAATAGTSAVIVDPEGEYERLVRWLGGDYLEIAPGRCGSLNVFDPARPGAEGLADAAANVVDLISVLAGGGLSELDRAHVDNAVRLAQTAAEREERQALLGDCLPFLEKSQPGLTIVLRRFCEGPLGALFNRPTSIQLEAGVVGLSLRELKSEFVPAATLVIAQWLWRLVQRGRRARHLVFDEVGMLAAHPTLRTLLVQLARRCRKYAASLVVATQNVQDLLQSDEGTVVATNCGIVLLGGHRPAETARMERAFGLTDAQRRFLENAGRGEFLLLAGNQRLEIRVQVPELHRRLLDPLEAD